MFGTPDNPADLLVVGGGINGAGVAADAAGRGLSVILCEQKDLAGATSSASSKLIHGGLRYLEHYEFRLVREALKEREVLLEKAPHLIKPLRFVLPHSPHLRPRWMILSGMFLYDHLGKRKTLAASNGLRFGPESPLKPEFKRGFEYSDCFVDDARLVVLNALIVQRYGGEVLNRTSCTGAVRQGDLWKAELKDLLAGTSRTVYARGLVNAAGPWVEKFLREDLQRKSPYGVRLIQGSHIVVPRIHPGAEAYILQNVDQRVIFVIPYLGGFSVIGTTDQEYKGDPYKVKITDAEIDYLIGVSNAHFKKQISRDDIVWTWSGVRPLCDDESDDPSAITRDYTVEIEDENGKAPLLSIFGGKVTTYRKLSESAMNKLAPYYPSMGASWTKDAPLPGGDMKDGFQHFKVELKEKYPFLDSATIKRMARNYGTLCATVLNGVNSLDDMGEHIGAGLYTREVDYLVEREWARGADDIIWRRSKLGLLLKPEEVDTLREYLASRHKLTD